ncbi:MAG: hypothetical protein F6J87_02855 [Spirulina sp. SIO3F2]|nr:hypothetical protein [Spirulina sp. SIO3F2]
MNYSTSPNANLAKNILMVPFVVIGTVFISFGAFAIGFNYQGEINIALTRAGGELIIKSCRR